MDKKKVRSVSSQVMELQQLIAGPLIATIEADSLSSAKVSGLFDENSI